MEGMKMSNEEKKISKALAKRRYAEVTDKKQKGLILDEFCAAWGECRKSVIRMLSSKSRPQRKRGRPFKTDMEARKLLCRIWKLAGRPCSRLLQPVIGLYIESLRQGGANIPDELAESVTGMSASTIDRRLRTVKPCAGGGRRASSLSEHRREVPLKVEAWPPDAALHAGWVEVDSVALCGGSMAGSFCWALTVADTASQWTEIRVTWNNGAEAVVGRLREMSASLPFVVRGVNSDNGQEFLNGHLKRHFRAIFPKALRSRSRPYQKNDNALVEQKNGHRVRRLFGFGRYKVAEAVEAMNRVALLQSLYDNLYRPTLKLLSKTQAGHRYRKVFEREAKTPAQRVLEDPAVSNRCKARVRKLLAQNDPLRLIREISKAKDAMWKAIAEGREHLQAASTSGGGSALCAAPSGTRAARGGGAGSLPNGLTSGKGPASSVTRIMTQPSGRVHQFR